MKILLLNTTPTSEMFDMFQMKGSYNGSGWVDGVIQRLGESNEVHFVCFWTIDEYRKKIQGNVQYSVIPAASANLNEVDQQVLYWLSVIYKEFSPDVIHVFGTEHKWTRAALQIMDPRKIVVHITGLMNVYALHYYGGLTEKMTRVRTLRDLLKGGMKKGKLYFEKNGEYEKETLSQICNVMGRTTWDKACITLINPEIKYFHCNEMLRNIFYEKQWKLEKCEKYRIFVSAGNTPLKGIHKVLEAIVLVKKIYPQVRLVVAGNNVVKEDNLKDRLKMTSYGKMLINYIKKNHLDNNVLFIGPQNALEMQKQYLKSHVYVLPSAIENSSNSLGEAMLLGMPCVASCVGGVQDLLRDKEDGYIYPYDEPYMLAFYIMQFFQNDGNAVEMGKNARKHAMDTHDREKIYNNLMKIYSEVMTNSQMD